MHCFQYPLRPQHECVPSLPLAHQQVVVYNRTQRAVRVYSLHTAPEPLAAMLTANPYLHETAFVCMRLWDASFTRLKQVHMRVLHCVAHKGFAHILPFAGKRISRAAARRRAVHGGVSGGDLHRRCNAAVAGSLVVRGARLHLGGVAHRDGGGSDRLVAVVT